MLAQAAPEEVLATLRAPLTEALADVAQEADRGHTFAAAEALGGLVASGAVFASGGFGWSWWRGLQAGPWWDLWCGTLFGQSTPVGGKRGVALWLAAYSVSVQLILALLIWQL